MNQPNDSKWIQKNQVIKFDEIGRTPLDNVSISSNVLY